MLPWAGYPHFLPGSQDLSLDLLELLLLVLELDPPGLTQRLVLPLDSHLRYPCPQLYVRCGGRQTYAEWNVALSDGGYEKCGVPVLWCQGHSL